MKLLLSSPLDIALALVTLAGLVALTLGADGFAQHALVVVAWITWASWRFWTLAAFLDRAAEQRIERAVADARRAWVLEDLKPFPPVIEGGQLDPGDFPCIGCDGLLGQVRVEVCGECHLRLLALGPRRPAP